MGSMDKIKPNKNLIEKWSKKYPGDYLISEKLDGMSCLLVLPSEKDGKDKDIKLYSRGDGEKGNDISQLLKYINIFSKKKATLNDIRTKIKSDDKFKLMTMKGVYPYEFMDSYEKLHVKELPAQDKFNSRLYNSKWYGGIWNNGILGLKNSPYLITTMGYYPNLSIKIF
jgi:hypothetical protein